MKVEVTRNHDMSVTDVEQFTRLLNERVNPEQEYSRKKFAILAIPQIELDAVKEALEYTAEEFNPEDFDDDGNAKQINEDESISDFLKLLFYVCRVPSTYCVTTVFTVEAESEGDAEEQVSNFISGRADYEIQQTEEQ